jgi:glucose-6-phosphate dehydrogenase assembly protein OpcA
VSVATPATPYREMRGTTVRAIEAELGRLWHEATSAPGHAAGVNGQSSDGVVITEKGAPSARTSVMNLIVTVPDEQAGDRILATLLGLGPRHPSRAIVLRADPSATGDPIDARIGTRCRTSENGDGQVCFEQLALTVRGEAARHLDGIVAPLLIHDLPIDVWWPGDPPFDDPVFNQLVEVGDRLIVNASDFADLPGGLKRLAGIRRRSGVGDVTWERLAPWHELTAQFFDAPRFRRYLANLSRLRIQYAVPEPGAEDGSGADWLGASEIIPGVASPAAAALLYAGWIATRLAWRRAAWREPLSPDGLRYVLEGRYEMVDLGIEPVPTSALPPGELVSVRLRAFGETGSAEFFLDRAGAEATIATNADGMTAYLRHIPLEPESEADVIRRQLSLDQRDLTYEDALRAAAILASTTAEAG